MDQGKVSYIHADTSDWRCCPLSLSLYALPTPQTIIVSTLTQINLYQLAFAMNHEDYCFNFKIL